jgi:hypothetical protein
MATFYDPETGRHLGIDLMERVDQLTDDNRDVHVVCCYDEDQALCGRRFSPDMDTNFYDSSAITCAPCSLVAEENHCPFGLSPPDDKECRLA